MPEGHTIRRDANRLYRDFAGQVLALSPQGRFSVGARSINSWYLVAADAHGKHLFLGFAEELGGEPLRWLHVHLGLYGKWTVQANPQAGPPPPVGAVRLRLVGAAKFADLRGPTACEVIDADQKSEIHRRLGADPLRPDADVQAAGSRIRSSRTAIGVLLMKQEVIAGVGNVYRAEVLFRAGLNPYLPGRELSEKQWGELWADQVSLLTAGVRAGRMITTRVEHRPGGRVSREFANYVYRRTGLPCRICEAPIATEKMCARNLYYCPQCQP